VDVVIEFETPRLLLRQWRAADREPFAALNADPAVMAHFPAPLTRQESDATADRCERFIRERGWGPTHCNYRLSREAWLAGTHEESSSACRRVTTAGNS
jgi:RimJ/RimL family protein N-acetyltransferase